MKTYKSSLLFVVISKLWIVDSLAVKFAPVIETNKGPIRGTILETAKKSLRYFSYRNIRYAKAPVGYLRFKPPVEVDSWTEVLDAVADGPVCPQVENDTMIGQEDCLNLNVYTPKLPEKNATDNLMPVMFWIYGGAFVSGNNKRSKYSPDYLIEEGIVFVSINYRLGPLGFLALSHPNATGNVALKDQHLGLRWVRKNIAKFGGDPKRVTIFGQSAGGASVDFHMISEKSKGLFHRAITMSGSSLAVWALHTPKVARTRAFQLARKLGSKAKTVDSLLRFYYNVETKSLIEMTSKLTIADVPFKPTIEDLSLGSKDDLFLTECPIRAYETGNFARVPYMLGHVKDEALSMLGKIGDFFDPKDYMVGEYLKMLNLNDRLSNFLDPITKITPNVTNISIFTDLLFIAPMDYAQRLISNYKSPVYYYRYIYDYDKSLHKIIDNVPVNGTAHSDEIPMIFYSDSFQIDPNENSVRELVQRRMTRLWTNFAKFGNPTPKGTKDTLLKIVWPDSSPNGKMLEISDTLKARDRYSTTQIEAIEAAIGTLGRKHSGCAHGSPKILDML